MNRFLGKRLIVALPALGALLGLVTPAQAQTKAVAAEMTARKALGSKSAPITMEVFSDFQCPSCRSLYEQTLRPLIANYVDTGKVYLIHRDFPLPIHKHSREAARWANAAARLGKFEKVETALYAKQDVWAADGSVEAVVAGVLTPVEMKKARQWMQSGQLDAAIDKDVSLGQMQQVRQTPSVFVTHRGQTVPLPPGGITYPLLKQYLDYLLGH